MRPKKFIKKKNENSEKITIEIKEYSFRFFWIVGL